MIGYDVFVLVEEHESQPLQRISHGQFPFQSEITTEVGTDLVRRLLKHCGSDPLIEAA